MKVLHVVYSFPPDPPGGTEIYVQMLARDLQRLGIDSVIAAPGPRDESYQHGGLRVRRFAIDQRALDVADLYGRGDTNAANALGRILDEERPEVYHQHALTAACSVQLVEQAKRRNLPVVFTYHTPTVSCQRGTLLEWGLTPCDGVLRETRCAACTLHGRGVSRPISIALANAPEFTGAIVGSAGLSGGAFTALRMRSLTRERIAALCALFGGVDRFVALSPWVRELLLANGVPEQKITDSAHGLERSSLPRRTESHAAPARIRIAHLGRIDPVKGTRILLQALRARPNAAIDLDVYGVTQNTADTQLLETLTSLAGSDSRIRFLPAITPSAVIEQLRAYDFLAVPSQWMETGPLVVLDAFAAGVPVIGSDLGGIADKVLHGVNGLLVSPAHSVEAWASALERCVEDPALVDRLAHGIRPVRASLDVARDMAHLYEELRPSTRQTVAAVRSR